MLKSLRLTKEKNWTIVTEHPWDPEVDELVILGEHVTLLVQVLVSSILLLVLQEDDYNVGSMASKLLLLLTNEESWWRMQAWTCRSVLWQGCSTVIENLVICFCWQEEISHPTHLTGGRKPIIWRAVPQWFASIKIPPRYPTKLKSEAPIVNGGKFVFTTWFRPWWLGHSRQRAWGALPPLCRRRNTNHDSWNYRTCSATFEEHGWWQCGSEKTSCQKDYASWFTEWRIYKRNRYHGRLVWLRFTANGLWLIVQNQITADSPWRFRPIPWLFNSSLIISANHGVKQILSRYSRLMERWDV